MGSDELAALLAGVRADLSDGAVYPHRVIEIHTPRLVAAVERLSELADEWRDLAGDGTGRVDRTLAACARRIDAAITAALTGAQLSEDGKHAEIR
jgi:acetoin utilization deacetylase AcuC-like enzyme